MQSMYKAKEKFKLSTDLAKRKLLHSVRFKNSLYTIVYVCVCCCVLLQVWLILNQRQLI